MNDMAIRVERLSKKYRIGPQGGRNLRESLMELLRWPGRGLKRQQEPKLPSSLWALKDVSFEVKPGQVVGIIGHNGAGKSTLLKILSGVAEPTKGEALVSGRVGSMLEVGTGFHPELTGRENIFLSGAILGMQRSEIHRQFDAITNFAEIGHVLDTPVKRYSSGMYARLAFAVASHLEADILMVDEVLAVGDTRFQKRCIEKISQVSHGEGRVILLVSHNVASLIQICDKVLWLDAGRIVEFSKDIRSVVRRYLGKGDDGQGPTEWVNLDNRFRHPCFTPTRMILLDHTGRPAVNPISNDTEIWLRIEGRIENRNSLLTIGFAIYSTDGQNLYWSCQNDTAPEMWPPLQNGSCTLRVKLPARLLNEGTYRIELISGIHWREWIIPPGDNAPAVNLTIAGGLSDSPLWLMKRPGLFAPVLQWVSG